ncbi:MAG: DNA primase [Chthoniobacterales bacterium]|nr:DNA primase [Chthoniobacterales bacterium]
MGRISEDSILRIVKANDIVEVIGSYLQLKRVGSNYRSLCPFHKEKTPSFTVSPSKQMYYCFGCGVGGGVIRFLMDYEHLSFVEAVRKLAQRAGISIKEETTGEDTNLRQKRLRLMELHKVAADWFHKFLMDEPSAEKARNFLRDRGIHPPILKSWKIGFSPEKSGLFLTTFQRLGWTIEELVESGICGKSEENCQIYERFRGRITVPITNDYGEFVGFSARVIDTSFSPAKYINTPETSIFHKSKILFGLDKTKKAIAEAGECIILEGQFDLITAFENGIKNVVAPLGTAFTLQHAILLRRFTSNVTLCFDADSAGQKAVERSLPILLSEGFSVRIMQIPPGDDPDSFLRKEGPANFKKLFDLRKPFLDYFLDIFENKGSFKTPEGTSQAISQLANLLCGVRDEIQLQAAINLISSRCQIAREIISKKVAEAAKNTPDCSDKDSQKEIHNTSKFQPPGESISLLCQLALTSSEVLAWLRTTQLSEISNNPTDLYPLPDLITSPLQPDNPTQISAYLDQLPPELAKFLSSLLNRKSPPSPLQAAQATWLGLRKQFLRLKINSIVLQLQKPDLPQQLIRQLHKELLDLKETLKNVPSQ